MLCVLFYFQEVFMKAFVRIFFVLVPYLLFARQVETFYGTIEVEEPVLLDLIDHPMFQRLKEVHQYGVAYYTTHREEYTRYDHSVGVFAILRARGAPLEEQIAGLLHDASHTIFSHVGEWVFRKVNKPFDYQTEIHPRFLEESGLGDVLRKHGFTIEEILPKNELFPALENNLPNLCADRIDYNLQGAYYRDFLTYEEVLDLFNDLRFVEDRWVSGRLDLMKKLALYSVFMTLDCWGSPENYVLSQSLADAILRAIEIGSISYHDLHFGKDRVIWDCLSSHTDPIIQKKMEVLKNVDAHYSVVAAANERANLVVKTKFRGIDPWVEKDSVCVRLSEIDKEFAEEYARVKEIFAKGWGVVLF